MSLSKDRLSNRQIATLKHLAVCCSNGGQVTLTRDQREAMTPLWRRELIETWYRQVPNGNPSMQGPFFRPTPSGWNLINALVAASHPLAEAA
jgi:hypothetical protein